MKDGIYMLLDIQVTVCYVYGILTWHHIIQNKMFVMMQVFESELNDVDLPSLIQVFMFLLIPMNFPEQGKHVHHKTRKFSGTR